MKIEIKKEDVTQPRKVWQIKPVQKPHGKKGYDRNKAKQDVRNNHE